MRALVSRGQETRAPIRRPSPDPLVVREHHERRHLLIDRTETVGCPSAQGRPPGKDRPRVHLPVGSDVVHAFRPAGSDHSQVIDMLGDAGIPIRNPQSASAVALPLPVRRHDGHAMGSGRARDRQVERWRGDLSGQLLEERLRVEQIDVARSAFHEQPNDRFRSRRVMRGLGDQRTRFRGRSRGDSSIASQKVGQRHGSKPAAGPQESVPAGGQGVPAGASVSSIHQGPFGGPDH